MPTHGYIPIVLLTTTLVVSWLKCRHSHTQRLASLAGWTLRSVKRRTITTKTMIEQDPIEIRIDWSHSLKSVKLSIRQIRTWSRVDEYAVQ